MHKKVYIIILNYNGWADMIECLESVLRNDKNKQKDSVMCEIIGFLDGLRKINNHDLINIHTLSIIDVLMIVVIVFMKQKEYVKIELNKLEKNKNENINRLWLILNFQMWYEKYKS